MKILHNFLTEQERSWLLEYTLLNGDRFVPTTTSTGEEDYRQSKILYDLPEVNVWFTQKIEDVLPSVFDQLNIIRFVPSQIEVQLTAHNDGHYYKIHNDNGSAEAATRVISYVYYFFREPKAFSGGELRLYDRTMTAIEPQNNSIVFFPSCVLHEVMSVVCPSGAIADSRFTVNGWIRR